MGILLQQTAVVAALAVGQTLVILTAGIDLSVGAIMVLSMMVTATLAKDGGMPAVLALVDRGRPRDGCRLPQRPARHADQPPAVHRHPRHAEHLHGHRAALLRRREHPGRPPATAAQLPRRGVRRSASSGSPGASSWSSSSTPSMGFVLSQTAWGRYVYAVGDDAESARLSRCAEQADPARRLHRGRPDLRHRRLDPHRTGRRGHPQRGSRRQPGQHHRGRHRRHQPLRWPGSPHRHPHRCPHRPDVRLRSVPDRASTSSGGSSRPASSSSWPSPSTSGSGR